jgi:hypothetical protein
MTRKITAKQFTYPEKGFAGGIAEREWEAVEKAAESVAFALAIACPQRDLTRGGVVAEIASFQDDLQKWSRRNALLGKDLFVQFKPFCQE